MYLGSHISIAGGLDKSLDRISEMGGNTLMTFASSPRSLQTKAYSDAEIKKYNDKKAALKIEKHYFHGIYLVNLATESKTLLEESVDSLIFYQQLAGQIGAVGTIFHTGSHKGRGLTETLTQIVQSINMILDSSPKGIKLILENSAGQGDTVGKKFEELKTIAVRIGDKSKIGFCLDTQHAFASGYKLETILDEFDRSVGLKHLEVIHLNDSLTDFASEKDRHANLGEGKIGLESLRHFVNDPRLKNIPFILEVPGDGTSGPRKIDLDKLKKLIS